MNGKYIAVVVAVIVVAVAGYFVYQNMSDDGQKVDGTWTYTLSPTFNNSETKYYDGTLSVIVKDGSFIQYNKNVNTTKVTEENKDSLKLKTSGMAYIEPAKLKHTDLISPDTDKAIKKMIDSNDCFKGCSNGSYDEKFTNIKTGQKVVGHDLVNNSLGRTYYVSLDGIILAISDYSGDTQYTYILDGWKL